MMRNRKTEKVESMRDVFKSAAWTTLLLLFCLQLEADDRTARTTKAKRASAETAQKKHPLEPAIRLAKVSRASLNNVDDYVARFDKKERVGTRMISHSMTIKNRYEPFSVYLRFNGNHEGREVIYVKGRNGGKLQVHEVGLAGIIGTISLLPTSSEAMSESIHPITSIGLWNMVDKVIHQWEEETKYGEVDVKYYGKAKLGKRACKVIESTHPRPRRQFRYHRTRLYLDKESNMPIRVEQYGFPASPGAQPPLIGEYQYTGVRVNQGLKNFDFDTRNPKYNY